MKNQPLNDLMMKLDVLAEQKIYPIGTKIYRVLVNGDILMEKVTAYEIKVEADRVDFRHIGESGRYGMSTPETVSGAGYGTKIHSWHFDRKSANKAAAPLIKAEKLKEIERNKDRIAEIQGQNMKLEAETR